MKIQVHPKSRLEGTIAVPGDKSISHRGLLFGGLAEGTTKLQGLSGGEDVRSTARCLEAMGIRIERGDKETTIHGKGLRGLSPARGPLDCGNSGSTMRMLMGILAGQSFDSPCFGDASLSRRPMKRVAEPLLKMGAQIEMTNGSYAPLTVRGGRGLRAIAYELPVASAQVKSAVMLAALYADGVTDLTGRLDSRDHTERLLPFFGARIEVSPGHIRVEGGQRLHGASLRIPGDPSSASFWAAGASLLPGSRVQIEHCLLNPSRIGFLKVLERMGAKLTYASKGDGPEPVGTVTVESGRLRGVTISPAEVPSLIDELPLFAILAPFADGVCEVRGAEELRVKETDRIDAVAENLRRLGGEIETFPDGFRIVGGQKLRAGVVDSFHDHRIAMAFSILALRLSGVTEVDHAECVAISYPAFYDTLEMVAVEKSA